MILLEELRVHNFKVLTGIDLSFPRQGAVLIEGLNEAGKSSLFESIYFALYGMPLVSEENRRSLDDVIRYGQNEALVTLRLEVDSRELEVQRHVRRGRPTGATLVIRRPGHPDEVVQGVRPVNQRLVQELGNLDSDALLNSCFIEQKKLDRLEGLGRAQRQESLLKLLNLEKLAALQETFRLTRQDDEALRLARDRLELAEAVAQLPRLQERRQEIDLRLAAIEVIKALDEIQHQEGIQAQCRHRIAKLEEEKRALAERLRRIVQLREAREAARRLHDHLQRAEELTEEVQRLEGAIRQQQPELVAARDRLETGRQRLRQGRVREGLQEWLRLRQQAEKVAIVGSEVEVAQTRVETTGSALAAAVETLIAWRRRAGRLRVLTLVLLLLGLIPGIIVYFFWTRRALSQLRSARQEEDSLRQQLEGETETLRQHTAQQGALRHLGGDPQRRLSDVQERIRLLGEPIPSEVALGQRRLDGIQEELGESTLAELTAAESAAAGAAQLVEDARRELEAKLKATGDGLQKLDGKALRRNDEALAVALAALGWPGPADGGSQAYAALLERIEGELQSADEAGTRRRSEEASRQLGEEQNRHRNAESAIASAQGRIVDLLRSHGFQPPESITAAGVRRAFPLVSQVNADEASSLKGQLEELLGQIGALEIEMVKLRQRLGVEPQELELEACRGEVEQRERQRGVRDCATRILNSARERMVRKVLPNTERNMTLILPLLTANRYHTAQITEDYRIQVWDEVAGRYVSKNIFSGGTKDQFSLALRLAFALATLPQELGSTPGFIFLDEPLSSFDVPRTQSLVDLLTQGQIAANFPQIFVISHNRSFDPETFPYRIVIEEGRVTETNLPQPPPAATEAPAQTQLALDPA